jgi:hypothetical protein
VEATDRVWQLFLGPLQSHLTGDDDPHLWQTAIQTILADAQVLCQRCRDKSDIFAQIGRCSHWLSPHNKGSWFTDKRFAWASGYGGSGWAIYGLPEFDWSEIWEWNKLGSSWEPVQKPHGKRRLLLRVALPARTRRHVRAVVHTSWSPRTPTTPEKLIRAYGFRRAGEGWRYVSTSGRYGERGATEYD